MYSLLYALLLIAGAVIDTMLGYGSAGSYNDADRIGVYASSWGPAEAIVMLALLIPNLSVAVRRLHDTDRRGWWLLIAFVPLIGFIVLLVFLCLDGTRGPNRFGADPKGPGDLGDVFA